MVTDIGIVSRDISCIVSWGNFFEKRDICDHVTSLMTDSIF
jgi:hypothetical protein